jgi:hypothetical protein
MCTLLLGRAVLKLRRLAAGLSPLRPGFNLGSDHVGFVVNKVALWQVFSEYFGFPCQFSFRRLLHTHLPELVQYATQLQTYPVDSVSPNPQKTAWKVKPLQNQLRKVCKLAEAIMIPLVPRSCTVLISVKTMAILRFVVIFFTLPSESCEIEITVF